jgi:hypothetical protein
MGFLGPVIPWVLDLGIPYFVVGSATPPPLLTDNPLRYLMYPFTVVIACST